MTCQILRPRPDAHAAERKNSWECLPAAIPWPTRVPAELVGGLAGAAGILGNRQALAAALLGVAVAGLVACGSNLAPAVRPPATGGGGPTAANSSGSAATTYELHSIYYSRAAKLASPLNPKVFVTTAGSPAGLGPEAITHTAGVTPAPVNAAASTPLVAADGTPLKITIGDWIKASGLIRLSCVHGQQQPANSPA